MTINDIGFLSRNAIKFLYLIDNHYENVTIKNLS